MQRIVVDTNILISSLIQHGYPYLIINEFVIENNVLICVSNELIAEYYEVINRNKFSKYPDFINKAETLLTDIEAIAQKFYPETKVDIISDKDDNKLLELASVSNANYIITGNTNDFTMKKYKRTKIVTPREYWEKHRPE